MNDSDIDKRNLLFEEYKMFRDTAVHFDQILIDIRKSTITLAFIIFGFAVEVFRITDAPFGLNAVDLAIVIILIELLMVMTFFYLEFHYRFYLTKITTIAAKYEEQLGLGIELKDCDLNCNKKRAGISKCLTCIHNQKMAYFTRVAHFNIYASLLSLGLVAFNALMGFKIGLSIKDIAVYSFIMALIAFGSTFIYGLRDIRKRNKFDKNKKQNKLDKLEDNFNVYLLSIISFVAFTYIFYYFIMSKNFALSFFVALVIGVIIFFVYGFYSAKIEYKFKRLLFYIGVAPEKF